MKDHVCCAGGTCVEQDKYDTGDAQDKISHIFAHNDAVLAECDDEDDGSCLNVNFLSAQGRSKSDESGEANLDFITPAAVAVQVNEVVMERCGELTPGLYLADFPGKQLVEGIIQRNFE